MAGAAVLLWTWIQTGAGRPFWVTAAVVFAGAWLVAWSSTRIRLAGAVTLGLVGGYWLLGFYLFGRATAAHTWTRLDRLPGGPYCLSVATLIGLFILHELLHESLRRRRLGTYRVTRLLGLAAVFAVSVDLFFLNDGPLEYEVRKTQLRHPFLNAREGISGTYGFVHATERWVTDNRNIRFSQQKPPGVTRIILDGASTMFGHGLPDDQCVATRLREALQARQPDRQFEVLTIAFPGGYQLNELVDTVVLYPHWSPDLVISFNGYNEVAIGENLDLFEGMPMDFSFELTVVQGSLDAVLTRLSHFAAARWIRGEDKRRRNAVRVAHPSSYEPPRYFSYLRQTASALAEMGVPYVYSFCPTVYGKTELTPTERAYMADADSRQRAGLDAKATVLQRTAVAARIVEEEDQIHYDAMAAIGEAGESFIDDCHLNEAATKRVAEDMAHRVAEWLQRRPRLRGPLAPGAPYPLPGRAPRTEP